MNFRITEDTFEKIYILARIVADLNNRLANDGNVTNTVWMEISGNANAVELGILKSRGGVAYEAADSYAWYYDDAIKSSTFEGAREFLQEWEKKLFPEEKESEKCASEAFYIEKPIESWANHVYECSACGQKFMIDRRLPNWCPTCGRALDFDANGELEEEE